jgi:hypothetical protein
MMYKLFVLLFAIMSLASCDVKKVKTDKKNISSENNQKDTAKAELDTGMISLRSFRTIAIDDLFCQDWNMDDADQKHWNELFWDSVSDKRKYPGLCLFRDFTFTENVRADIKTGKWKLDKPHRLLLLSFNDGTKKTYYIQQVSVKAITLVWRKPADSIVMNFSSDNLVHKRVEDDPFYHENNKWRIKPLVAENNLQVRQRVKECVHFYALFYKDNLQRRETDISFIGLPGCFEWYNGGISLPKAIELDKKWINCFYSEDQAYRGYDMLKTFLETQKLKWPDRKIGWVGQTQAVLEQIRDKL